MHFECHILVDGSALWQKQRHTAGVPANAKTRHSSEKMQVAVLGSSSPSSSLDGCIISPDEVDLVAAAGENVTPVDLELKARERLPWLSLS